MTLLELRDALKAAAGPDWNLSIEIELALAPGTIDRRSWDRMVSVGVGKDAYNPPPYTASLDAAVTLVPEDVATVEATWSSRGARVKFWQHHGSGRLNINVIGDTPALALCLARVEYEIAKEPAQ